MKFVFSNIVKDIYEEINPGDVKALSKMIDRLYQMCIRDRNCEEEHSKCEVKGCVNTKDIVNMIGTMDISGNGRKV